MDDINAALDGLTFTPNTNYTGSAATAKITTSDLGHTGSGGAKTDTDTVAIIVNPQLLMTGMTLASSGTGLGGDATNSNAFLNNQVDVLVSAMASFAAPSSGQTTALLDDRHLQQPLIAANWK